MPLLGKRHFFGEVRMKLVTIRDNIRRAPEMWKRQYFVNGAWKRCVGGAEAIYKRLLDLDLEVATPEEMESAGASWSWMTGWCSMCNRPSGDTVYGKEGVGICKKCAQDAVDLFNGSI